jgi:hypothetical protein
LARDAAAQDNWAAADSAVVRLAPSAFKALPTTVRADLDRRGCRIPQVADEPEPTNVITGNFLGRDSNDWTILCSVNRVSRVLVYSSDSRTVVDSLFEAPDRNFLQTMSGGRIGFSRMISKATSKRIRAAAARYKTPTGPISHDGIEIAFVDKASSIYYWNGKRWMEFAASD